MRTVDIETVLGYWLPEKQGEIIVSKESFLAALRVAYVDTESPIKGLLTDLARVFAKGVYVNVVCSYETRYAAQALIEAYTKMSQKIKGSRTGAKTYKNTLNKHVTLKIPKKENRFRTTKTTVFGKAETIQQYPADISWEEAEKFQDNCELPEVTTNQEYIEVSETAHFNKASYEQPWGQLFIDGIPFGRTRCWAN